MESTEDKQWASKYLLDPLNALEPSEETGPGSHHVRSFTPSTQRPSTKGSLEKKENTTTHSRQTSIGSRHNYSSPPPSTSPRTNHFSHRQPAFSGYEDIPIARRSLSSTEVPTSSVGRQRTSSLISRFPGDNTCRPLDTIKRETKIANRAPHLRKKHIVGPDSIDSLDTSGRTYHHDGPYDATLLARNMSLVYSPVEAVLRSNEEALKATPREKINDSVEKHRPLDGVAMVAPGRKDRDGRTYHYEEGSDLMIEEGNYKRWPGVEYLPEDLKGKGEPSFSMERALKEHKSHRRVLSDSDAGIEMNSRPQSSEGGSRPSSSGQKYSQWETDMRRSNTTGSRIGGTFQRFGNLRKSKKTD